MEWNSSQLNAMSQVGAWLKERNRKQVFKLFGYGGTGKTTLIVHMLDQLNLNVLYAAYTGKAADVMRSKGCHGASTIHSLAYISKQRSEESLRQAQNEFQDKWKQLAQKGMKTEAIEAQPIIVELKARIEKEKKNLAMPAFTVNPDSIIRDCDLLVIDECSMVDEKMGKDLCSFGVPILVLGDPGQLPPIRGAGYFIAGTPDVMLTQVERQARENPIIHLATLAREGKPIPYGSYGESRVISREALRNDPNIPLQVDQILVGRNETRRMINTRMRELLGRTSPLPMVDDRLVCLRNDHDVGLLNGTLWTVEEVFETDGRAITLLIEREDKTRLAVSAHTHYFIQQEDQLEWWEKKDHQEFDYGYGITVHKSQGSQWDNLLLVDEATAFRDKARNWRYTGITRAVNKITVAI